MDIKKTAEEIHSIAREKGFWESERNIGEMLMLVVSELGEALEAHRNGNIIESHYKDMMSTKGFESPDYEKWIKGSFEEEIADTVIRLFDLSEGLGIDLEWHIRQKMEYNKTRPFKHSKKY